MREKGQLKSMISFLELLHTRHTFYVPYPWQLPIITVLSPTEYHLYYLLPPPQPAQSTSSPCPMNMYFLKSLRSFPLSPSPRLRASLIHDGIVRSSIEYGAYFAPRP